MPPATRKAGTLLITDDRDDAALALFADALVLGVSAAPPLPASAVVCHVALNDPATLDALETALATCRPGAKGDTALIFALRSDDVLSYAIANGLGATRIIAADRGGTDWTTRLGPGEAPFVFAARPATAPATAAAERDVSEQAATAATVLANLFAAAKRRAPIVMADIERGAAAVLHGARDDIRIWVEVVRRYDDATYQHCLLVAGFCAALSERVGLSGVRQHLVVQAALLHDIGKARVPLALLNKPGALTAAEATVMRRHPTDGYYMLAGQGDIPATIRDVVLHHHELLDGSGYPHGLRAAQIPEEVRLSTVCDVYAALVERRPYREPMAPQPAFAILVGMGSKLDAMFVAALGGLLETPRASEWAGELARAS